MADLLAATSLLITVLTILYSLWYPEISEASKRVVVKYAANRENDYNECRGIFWGKAFPLALFAAVLVASNFPDAYHIVHVSAIAWTSDKPFEYGAVNTIYVFAVVVALFLLSHTVYFARRLGKRVGKLNPKRGDTPD